VLVIIHKSLCGVCVCVCVNYSLLYYDIV